MKNRDDSFHSFAIGNFKRILRSNIGVTFIFADFMDV